MAAPPPVKPRSGSVSGATPLPGMTAAARAEQNPQGNYTFKVLRMNRPSFAMPGLPLHCAASDSASLGTDALVLPKAFGTIFLGEVFHGYVAFCNNGSQDFTRCVLKAEINCGARRTQLMDNSSQPIAILPAKSTHDFLIQHEISSDQTHIITLEASFKEGLEEKKYRQYFRFTVSKPLSITTKMNNIGDSVILRNTIVNESGCPFFFEKICFVPQPPYTCTDLNCMATDSASTFSNASASSSSSGFADALVLPAPFADSDATAYMRHQDSRCFMYSLRLPAGSMPPPDGTLGRLEMRWRQSMGESGSLHTVVNMQQFKQPEPFAVEVAAVPANAASIFVEEPFDLIVTVKNRGPTPLNRASLLLPCNSEASIIPLGMTEIGISSLAPGISTSLTVQMLPVEQGLREIAGICVHDEDTFLSYQMSSALFVNVQHSK